MTIFNRISIGSFPGTVSICLLFTVVFLAGCSGKHNRGRLIYNNTVKEAFETYKVLPGYNYYLTGPENYPKAVIGIRKEYRLESKFWKPVELTPERLKRWLEWRGSLQESYNRSYYGLDILTPDGRQAGIWYTMSVTKNYGRVEMIDEKTIVVGSI
jgi:hypothetical protein